MVKQSCPSNFLLIPATERFSPFPGCFPTSFPVHDVLHLDNGKNMQQIIIRNATYKSFNEKRALDS
jgi:hypothetical protein